MVGIKKQYNNIVILIPVIIMNEIIKLSKDYGTSLLEETKNYKS